MKPTFLRLLGVTFLGVFLLTACSKEDDDPEPQNQDAVATATIQPENGAEVQFVSMSKEEYPFVRWGDTIYPAVYDNSKLSLFFMTQNQTIADTLVPSYIRIDMKNVTGEGKYVLKDWVTNGYVLYFPKDMVTSHDFYTTETTDFQSEATINITTFTDDHIAGIFKAVLFNRENENLKVVVSNGKFSCALKQVDDVNFWD